MDARTYLHGAAALVALILIMTIGSLHTSPQIPESEGLPALSGATTTEKAEQDLQVFGSIPYWDQPRASAVVREHIDVFDYLSVFWYRLDDSGAIQKYQYAREDMALVKFAQGHGVKVLALIANLPEEGDWDANAVGAAIGSDATRKLHVQAVSDLVVSKGFDGVNIDYEMLEDSQTEDFSAFIRDLSSALHAKGKIVAVAIHAQEPGGETRGQDLVALQSADILSFMTYDEHWDTGEPGPVASLPWMRNVLTHARSLDVDMQKIFMGIPLYGYDWPQDGEGWGTAAGLEYEEILTILGDMEITPAFDANAQAWHFKYEEDGTQHEVWYEDVRSFEPKYELAKEFGVKGVMFWRQGREDDRIYDIHAGE